MLDIRKATRDDALRLSRIAEETFRATFGSVNSSEDMDLHCQRNFSEVIQAGEIASPDMLTLLCEESGSLTGFAQLRFGAAPACVTAKSPVEIQRLYVASHWHGKGVAQELMRACIDEAKRRGSETIWLGVWEHNPRAIAFYRKCGFFEVGDHVFPLGRDQQRDIVMARSLHGETHGT